MAQQIVNGFILFSFPNYLLRLVVILPMKLSMRLSKHLKSSNMCDINIISLSIHPLICLLRTANLLLPRDLCLITAGSLKPLRSTHFAYHSLWYTYGESYGYYDNEYKMKGSKTKSSIIIASEPLTEDTTTWVEVPEYTLLLAIAEPDGINIITKDINI